MSTPFFSIIIPTYNSAKTVAESIQSVLVQSLQDFEIVLVDGLSKDDTMDVVKSFASDKLVYTSEKDAGIYDAMNKGVKMAKGSWLLFLGSDDTLYNNEVLQMVKDKVAAAPQTKFVYGDVATSLNTIQRYDDYNYKKLLKLNICHQSIFYHRSLFNDKSYDLQYPICADWDMNLKVFNNSTNPVYIPQPLARFNVTGTSENWEQQPEYLKNFSNPLTTIVRYRGIKGLITYVLSNIKSTIGLALYKLTH